MSAAAESTPRARGVLETLRSGAWLTPARGRAYAWIFLALGLVAAAALALLSRGGLDPIGRPLGTDFTSFWAASRLALGGAPQLAYDMRAHRAVEAAITGRDTGYAAFFYPPVFLLLCLPLAALPYSASLAAWLAVTGVAYARVARAWLGRRIGWLPVFAFPAVLSNAGHGQNGFLSAALMGAGALWMDRRPLVAGACLGALVYKPHLGLMIPLALALSGRWRTFAAAAATVVALVAASVLAFGWPTWQAFLAGSGVARAALEQGLVGDYKLQSAFAAARVWGADLPLAYGLQGAYAAFAAGGLVWLSRRAPRSPAEGPAMILASLMASPFMLDYDLVILAAPLAFLLRAGVEGGFRPWEKTILAAAFVLPIVARTLAGAAHAPPTPFVLAALFVLVLRRACRPAVQAATASACA